MKTMLGRTRERHERAGRHPDETELNENSVRIIWNTESVVIHIDRLLAQLPIYAAPIRNDEHAWPHRSTSPESPGSRVFVVVRVMYRFSHLRKSDGVKDVILAARPEKQVTTKKNRIR